MVFPFDFSAEEDVQVQLNVPIGLEVTIADVVGLPVVGLRESKKTALRSLLQSELNRKSCDKTKLITPTC